MVVVDGDTVVVLPGAGPTSGAIETAVALATDQESVVGWPASMLEGEAANEEMVGPGVGAGVTVTAVAAVVAPAAFWAVRV